MNLIIDVMFAIKFISHIHRKSSDVLNQFSATLYFNASFGASATTSTGTNTNTPSINSPASTTTTPLGGSPYVTTPGNGVLGGVGSGLGPSGVGINNDDSHAGLTLGQNSSIFWLFAAIMFTMLGFLWG